MPESDLQVCSVSAYTPCICIYAIYLFDGQHHNWHNIETRMLDKTRNALPLINWLGSYGETMNF